jgi:predicted histone-like DNA-binding protein
MSLKYHIVERKDLNKEAAEGSTLFYGQIRKGDNIPFNKVCKKISLLSTCSKGDVQNVLDGLGEILREHLEMGQCIKIEGLGHFRMTAGCRGVSDVGKFSTALFKKARILFYPCAELREVVAKAAFEKLQPVDGDPASQPEDGNENPGEDGENEKE